MMDREDAAFMPATESVLWEGVHPTSHWILAMGSFCFFLALVWAYFAPLNEVTTGLGRVIPSGQVQVIQNLEGGILSEIMVREGDVVEKDASLLRLSDTQSSSSFRESRTR